MTVKTETQTYIYCSYIKTTPEKLWQALTQGDFSEQYWMGYRIELEQKAGGQVRIFHPEHVESSRKNIGKVIACEPGKRLVYEFVLHNLKDSPEMAAKRQGLSRVTYELAPMGELVRLRLIHDNLLPEDVENNPNSLKGVNNGWPAVLSSLKSLLETGTAITVALGCSESQN